MEKSKVVATGRWLTLVCASLGMLLSLPRSANAQSPLTWARVELVRNQVQLFTGGRSRSAQVSDVLGVDDALSTARRARAELRFNDGSLARIGESAIFRFTPNTRNFRLSNGTVLLLIPPGQGRTTIQTPNAVTGVRGSALFVRYVPETKITIIGALTTNLEGPMMAYNEDGSVQQSLNAGEMAVVYENGIVQHLEFDLEEFYLTSDLVSGLHLNDKGMSTNDEHIDAVRQETLDALEQQGVFGDGDDVQENPGFISARAAGVVASNTQIPDAQIPDFESSPAAAFLRQPSLIGEFPRGLNSTVVQPDPSLGRQPGQRPGRRPVGDLPAGRPDNSLPSQPPRPTLPVKPEPPVPTANPGQGGNPTVQPTEPGPTPGVPVKPEPPAPEAGPAVVVTPEQTPTIVPETVPEKPAPPSPLPLQEAPTLPVEAVVPPEENGLGALENLEMIESVAEPPETEAQLNRLPDAIVQESMGPETAAGNTPTPPPGQVGATPGQGGEPPPGQVGATPGLGNN